MKRILVKYFGQALLLLAPMLTVGWSFLDFVGVTADSNGRVDLGFPLLQGPKASVEFRIRVLISALGLTWVVMHDIYDYYLPQRDFKKFRKLYLDEKKEEWRTQLNKDIRINIMHANRYWFFPFLRFFQWTWSDGYNPPAHKDVNLLLTEFQGVCGLAFRAEEPKLVTSLPTPDWIHQKWLLLNQFHLSKRQLSKTKAVKAVLSVPIYSPSEGTSPTWKAIGVINLDTLTDEGSKFLEYNRQKLVDYFDQFGKMLACLR